MAIVTTSTRRFPETLGNVTSYAIEGVHRMANVGDWPKNPLHFKVL